MFLLFRIISSDCDIKLLAVLAVVKGSYLANSTCTSSKVLVFKESLQSSDGICWVSSPPSRHHVEEQMTRV